MAEPKINFELDVGKIVAKLHLAAGYDQYTGNCVFFNSGIVDDAAVSSKDADGKKITFDFEGLNYELGVKPLKFEFKPADPEDFSVLFGSVGGVANQKKPEQKPAGSSADDGKSGTTPDGKKEEKAEEKPEDKKDEKPENKKDEKRAEEPITAPPPDAKNVSEAEDEEDEEAKKAENKKTRDEHDARRADAAAKIKEQLKTEVENKKKECTNILKQYMTVFAGASAANGIKEDSVYTSYLPKDGVDPYKISKYDGYTIPQITEKEFFDEMRQEYIKNPKMKSIDFSRICFKIGYSLDSGAEK